jgi:hypothetical protein
MDPWYSHVAFIVVSSLFAAVLVYVPVLLARRMKSLGVRIGFILRVLFSTLLIYAIAFLAALLIGAYTNGWLYDVLWAGLGMAMTIAIIVNYHYWKPRDN